MVTHLIGFGVGVTLALGGDDVHKHRATSAMGILKRPHHLSDVMAIDRSHVGETKLFKNGPHFWDR